MLNAAAAGQVPDAEEVWVALAFSGGGHRASAFAAGVLAGLDATPLADGSTLADRVRLIAAVSGGAVTAGWFALHGPDRMDEFRERYLLADAERYLRPDSFGASDIAREIAQGADVRDTLGRVLDETLFAGVRFADLARQGRPQLHLVASDVAAAAPFVFDATTLGALCGDLGQLRLSDAVAASAAFPVIFAPVVLPSRAGRCTWEEPAAYATARADPDAPPARRLLAETVARYADPAAVQSVRLLDGGMTDIYGTAGIVAARAPGGIAPMTPAEAVRVRRLVILAADATQENWGITDRLLPSGRLLSLTLYGLSQRLSEAGGGELRPLLAGRGIAATTTGSAATLSAEGVAWRQDIIAWRCALDRAALDALYPDRPADWDCRDLHLHVDEIGIDDLPAGLRDATNDIPTRLRLPAAEVDLALAAGRRALEQSRAVRAVAAAVTP